MSTLRPNSLPPFAPKPRPVSTQSVRSASGHAVALSKFALPKQAGPKPRFPLSQDETDV